MSTLLAALFFVSCDKADQPTYTTTLLRLATVVETPYAASLSIDCTGESFIIEGFSTPADIQKYGLRNGARVFAQITAKITGSNDNVSFSLDRIDSLTVNPIRSDEYDASHGSYLYFGPLALNGITYPQIWSNGNFFNIVPVFYPVDDASYNVSLHTDCIMGDTLLLRLTSDIPGSDLKSDAHPTLFTYDISQISDTTFTSALADLDTDSIYVTVATCDTLSIKNGNATIITTGSSVTTRIHNPY